MLQLLEIQSYAPDTLTVKKGDVITVTNDDTAPHTVTNGASPGDADAGKLFDTSIIMPAATAQIDTATLEAGDHPFHWTCTSLHDRNTYGPITTFFYLVPF